MHHIADGSAECRVSDGRRLRGHEHALRGAALEVRLGEDVLRDGGLGSSGDDTYKRYDEAGGMHVRKRQDRHRRR